MRVSVILGMDFVFLFGVDVSLCQWLLDLQV